MSTPTLPLRTTNPCRTWLRHPRQCTPVSGQGQSGRMEGGERVSRRSLGTGAPTRTRPSRDRTHQAASVAAQRVLVLPRSALPAATASTSVTQQRRNSTFSRRGGIHPVHRPECSADDRRSRNPASHQQQGFRVELVAAHALLGDDVFAAEWVAATINVFAESRSSASTRSTRGMPTANCSEHMPGGSTVQPAVEDGARTVRCSP